MVYSKVIPFVFFFFLFRGALPYVGGCQVHFNRPHFFWADLTPNDLPFFFSPHPITPFFPLLHQILRTNCKFLHTSHAFWKIYKFCDNFNINLANFSLKLHFSTLNDSHFWESTSKRILFFVLFCFVLFCFLFLFLSPHRVTPFFQWNLTPNAFYFRSPVGTVCHFHILMPPPAVSVQGNRTVIRSWEVVKYCYLSQWFLGRAVCLIWLSPVANQQCRRQVKIM